MFSSFKTYFCAVLKLSEADKQNKKLGTVAV